MRGTCGGGGADMPAGERRCGARWRLESGWAATKTRQASPASKRQEGRQAGSALRGAAASPGSLLPPRSPPRSAAAPPPPSPGHYLAPPTRPPPSPTAPPPRPLAAAIPPPRPGPARARQQRLRLRPAGPPRSQASAVAAPARGCPRLRRPGARLRTPPAAPGCSRSPGPRAAEVPGEGGPARPVEERAAADTARRPAGSGSRAALHGRRGRRRRQAQGRCAAGERKGGAMRRGVPGPTTGPRRRRRPGRSLPAPPALPPAPRTRPPRLRPRRRRRPLRGRSLATAQRPAGSPLSAPLRHRSPRRRCHPHTTSSRSRPPLRQARTPRPHCRPPQPPHAVPQQLAKRRGGCRLRRRARARAARPRRLPDTDSAVSRRCVCRAPGVCAAPVPPSLCTGVCRRPKRVTPALPRRLWFTAAAALERLRPPAALQRAPGEPVGGVEGREAPPLLCSGRRGLGNSGSPATRRCVGRGPTSSNTSPRIRRRAAAEAGGRSRAGLKALQSGAGMKFRGPVYPRVLAGGLASRRRLSAVFTAAPH